MPATYKLNLLSPALSFDGVDDVVTVGDVWDFAGTAAFTVEFWIKLTVETADHRHILGKLTGAGDGWQVVKEPNESVHFNRRLSTDSNVTVNTGVLSLDTLYHVACTFDGSNIRIYLNGALVGGPTADILSLPNTAASFKFGGSSNVGPAGCVLDDVRIWNVARTQAQIAENRFRRLAGTESGLVGLWRMDEDTGTQVKDATSNANHGTLTGAAWSEREIADIAADLREYSISRGRSEAIRGEIVTGQARIELNNVEGKQSSPALSFDGVDDYVEVPDAPALDIVSAITLESWVKFDIVTTNHPTFISKDPINTAYLLWKSDDGGNVGWAFRLFLAGVQRSLYSNVVPVAGRWYHVAGTYDGSAMRLYVDGILLASQSETGTIGTTTGPLHFGAHGPSSPPNSGFIDGLLDENRIWNVARTQAQIQNNMHRRLAGNEKGLVGYWRLDEASGTQAQDATTNLNHGTITGAAWSTRDQAYFTEGTYSPDNPSSKFAGLLRPFLKARITATSGVTKDRFTGYILKYEPETRLEAGPEDSRVVNCVLEDRFKLLRAKRVTTGILADQTLGAIITEILDEAGVPSGERVLATTVDTSPFALFTDEAALEALRKPVEAGQYAHYIDPSGKYRLENRYWTLGAATYKTYDAEMVDFRPVYDEARILNAVQVKSNPRKKDASLAVVAKLQVPYELAVGASVELFLEYFDPSQTSFVRAPADEMVTPVATTDYTAGSTETGTDKTAQLGVVVVFFAEKSKVTLTNNDGATIFVSKFELRGKPLRAQTPILREASDVTSQEDFQKHDGVIDNDLIGKDLYAKDLAEFLVLDRKDVVPPAEMTLRNVFPDMLEIDLGTVIEIVESLTGVSYRWVVDGLRETVQAPGFEHTVTYQLRKHVDYDWLTLDKDPEGRLDQNRLGF
jgi:hypothetical protein